KMFEEKKNGIYNLGTGKGFSVNEIIEVAKKVTGKKIATRVIGRRAGDPDVLVASNLLARKELHWEIEIDDIEKIIESAWKFMVNFPDGYGG
ncbi:MAG: UDP-glucose 4-epimerase GalE, partial [Clostridia bacterium]|nr:UDP-glucose 4-epimerase GalE [Clostridia bacterium]